MKNKKILAVIPARGKSKGIKKKNIYKINGKALIYYTIKEAKKSKLIKDLIVSTDSKEIAKISKKYGAQVPFLRPAKLSTDFAPSLPVIMHAVRFMEKIKKIKYDYVIMLQPTCPLRKYYDIDDSLRKLINSNLDSITSVVDVEGSHPNRMKIIKNKKLINFIEQGFEDMRPRQKLKKVFIRNGAIYALKRKVIMKHGVLVGKKNLPFIMSKERSVNIDSQEDLVLAKYYLDRK